MPAQASTQINQSWTDLQQHLPTTVDRNLLIAQLQAVLCQYLQQFEQQGFRAFVSAFNQRDQFAGKPVCLSSGQQQIKGICVGVDAQGGIVLQQDGQLQSYYGGELSLRGQQ
jgi:BirA family biotin operon repressor/biotin-[acetyl-CoA-carboxylase] ligase